MLSQVGYVETIRRIEMRAEARGVDFGVDLGAKIAYQLSKGKPPEQIAADLGVSQEQVLNIAKKIELDIL